MSGSPLGEVQLPQFYSGKPYTHPSLPFPSSLPSPSSLSTPPFPSPLSKIRNTNRRPPPPLIIIISLACAFALVGAFVPPTAGSALSYEVTGLRWYIIPTIGLASLSIGYAYYLVFAKLIPRWRRQVRVIQRDPVIVRQFGKADGEWVQLLELVEIWWESRGQPSDSDDDDHDERHGHGHGHEA